MDRLPRKLKKLYRQFRRNPFNKFTVKQRKSLEKFLKKEDLRVLYNSIYNLMNTPLKERVFKPNNMPLYRYIPMLEEQFFKDEYKKSLKSPYENVIEDWIGENYESSI